MLLEKEIKIIEELKEKFFSKNYHKICSEAMKPFDYIKERNNELNKILSKLIFNLNNKAYNSFITFLSEKNLI